MPPRLKINALLAFLLALLFYLFFMYTKHDAALSAVNAFAEDPYDAVGSFGIQAAFFCGVVCLIRAFRPNGSEGASLERRIFVVRAQMVAVLSVGVTLASDAVGVARQPSLWFGSAAGHRLVSLLGGMAVLTVLAGMLVRRAAREMRLPNVANDWKKAAVVSLGAVLGLAFYPESLRQHFLGELLTIVGGAALLFVSIWAWAVALIPYRTVKKQNLGSASVSWAHKYQWFIVAVVGILIGLFFVAGEASEGTGIPHAKLALVVSVYLGLEIAGVLIGYSFLGGLLGLFRKDSR
ncbi:MAG: hypothetical protein ACYDD2_10175 [Candidatus Acidiferrales bacterium]